MDYSLDASGEKCFEVERVTRTQDGATVYGWLLSHRGEPVWEFDTKAQAAREAEVLHQTPKAYN